MKYAIILTIGVLIAFVGIKFWYAKTMWSSLAHADQIELRATYDRWVEAGRPEGVALQEFLRGRGSINELDTPTIARRVPTVYER